MTPQVTVVLSHQVLTPYPDFIFSDWQNIENWGQYQFEIYPSAASGVDVVVETADQPTGQGLQEPVEDTASGSTTGNDFIVPVKRFVWRWASASPFKLPIPNGSVFVRIGVAGAAGNCSVNLKRIQSGTN